MEFSEVLARRYSCRQYTDTPVEREKLTACLEAGRAAPSGCNSQRWLFIAVDEPGPREKIARSLVDPELGLNGFAPQIPAFIVVVGHPPRRLNPKQETILAGFECAQMDIGIAAAQICLRATDLGLGSIMMGWFKPDMVREALDIPGHLEVALVIGLGYPAGDIRRPSRYPLEEVARWNNFNNKEDLG